MTSLVNANDDELVVSDGIHGNGQYGFTYPDAITLSDGNILAFGTGGDGTIARILSPDGQALSDDILLATTSGYHDLVALPGGGWAMAYEVPGDSTDIALRIFDAAGQPTGVEIAVTGRQPEFQSDPQITLLDDGNIVVVWQNGGGQIGQVYDTSGNAVGSQFGIAADYTASADIAATPDGGFVAVWVDHSPTYAPTGGSVIVGERFNADGTPNGGTFQIGQVTFGGELDPSVTVLNDGTIAVAFRHVSTVDLGHGSLTSVDIWARLIHPDGTVDPVIAVTHPTITSVGNSERVDEFPEVVALADGGFAVGFTSVDQYRGYGGRDYYIATFDADGNRTTGNQLASHGDGNWGGLAALQDGSVVAVWGNPGAHGRIFAPTMLSDIIIDGDGGDNVLTGSAANETLNGGAGNDHLDGGSGVDLMRGGDGDDSYFVDDARESVIEDSIYGGDDTVTAGASWRLAESMYVEHLVAAAGTAPIDLTGNGFSQSLQGNGGNNILDGGGGEDTFAGGAGDDTYVILGDRNYGFFQAANAVVENAGEGTDTVIVTIGDYTLPGNIENLTGTEQAGGLFQTLTGNELDNVITGGSADVLNGLAGNDTLVRTDGYGTMAGGTGDDLYILAPNGGGGEQIIENAGEGIDEVRVAVGPYTLAANIENLTGTGTVGQQLTGNTLDNRILAGSGNDNINAQDGNDFIDAGAGNDSVSGDAGNDVLDGAQGNDTLSGGDGADVFLFKAGGGADTIADFAAGDQIDIGGYSSAASISQVGANVLVTLAGGDSITVQNATVAAVQSALHFGTFGSGGDDSLSGSSGRDFIDGFIGNDTISGLAGDDSIRGGDGNDILNGGGGNDTLDGGAGIDTATYATVGAGVTVSLAISGPQATGGAGMDMLTGIENLTGSANGDTLTGNGGANILSGGGGADKLMGAAGDDTLDGGIGNDVLDGGIGADALTGGAGSDTYWVDNVGDTVTENGNEGVDTVHAGLSWTLGANIENLVLAGTAAIDGTGNGLNNAITGNIGDNHLAGLGGNDNLSGLGGNDTLDGGSGTDRLSGGAGNDSLSGGEGNDTLDGGSGNDSMAGSLGNDTYVVDSASDTITENSGEGTDTVKSSVGLTLGANLENLTLSGTGNISGTGNELDNLIIGNSGANILTGLGGNDTLKGGAGNDTLDGGAGRDTLNGGTGADQFVFHDGDFGSTNATADVIYSFSSAEADKVDLHGVDANTLLGGDQAFSFIGTDGFHNVAGELRYQEVGGNTYVYADLDGDGHSDLAIMLGGTHALTSGDFIL